MTEFKTVTTFEKCNSDVLVILQEIPEFTIIQHVCFPDHSPYISSKKWKVLNNNSYIEVFLNFYDKTAYLQWNNEFGEIHDSMLTVLIKKLEDFGVTINRYVEDPYAMNSLNSFPLTEYNNRV